MGWAMQPDKPAVSRCLPGMSTAAYFDERPCASIVQSMGLLLAPGSWHGVLAADAPVCVPFRQASSCCVSRYRSVLGVPGLDSFSLLPLRGVEPELL